MRKSRTKIYRSSSCQNISSGKAEATSYGSALIETSSCMSGSSSAASSARSRYEDRGSQKLAMVRDDRTRRNIGSTHIRRRAEAILKMLSGGCFSEVRIRQELGDSPDTSKALRMWSFSLSPCEYSMPRNLLWSVSCTLIVPALIILVDFKCTKISLVRFVSTVRFYSLSSRDHLDDWVAFAFTSNQWGLRNVIISNNFLFCSNF